MHAYIQLYINIYIYVYMHAYIHIHIQTLTQRQALENIQNKNKIQEIIRDETNSKLIDTRAENNIIKRLRISAQSYMKH